MRILVAVITFSVLLRYVCSYTLTQTDIDVILKAHNDKRSFYNVPPLKWDASIAAGALQYSDKCVWGHSGAAGLGENIGYVSPPQNPGTPVTIPFPYLPVDNTVSSWNGEEKNWDCETNTCAGGSCGHFTQDIWSATTSVGCGLSKCQFSGFWSQYLVCRYNPPGNYGGQHPANAPSSQPRCPGSNPPPLPPPPSTPTTVKPPPVNPPPTPASAGGYSACKVACNGQSTYCSAQPQIISNKVYCKCLSESMMWPVVNAGTTDCTYWPAGFPLPLPFTGCKADFNGQERDCEGTPTLYSGDPTYYCPCGDPGGYSWPLKNGGTSDCRYGVSMAETDSSSSTSSTGLTTGQWAGICVGVLLAAIIIVAIVVVKSRRSAEFV